MSKNTESLIERIKQREERGLSKYGTTLDLHHLPRPHNPRLRRTHKRAMSDM